MTTITIPAPNLGGIASLIQREPAIVFYATNAATAIGVLWGFHLTSDQTGLLSVITTAVASAIIALLTRPVAIPILKGSVLTVLTALEAFHFHASSATVGLSLATLSIIVGLLFRQNLTPVAGPVGPVVVSPVTEVVA